MSAADVGVLLVRALERAGDAAGLTVAVTRHGWTRWASATFTGARHELALDLPAGAAAQAWLAALPEAELTLRGHLVADLKLIRSTTANGQVALVIEALTVEDR